MALAAIDSHYLDFIRICQMVIFLIVSFLLHLLTVIVL